jgi:ACR3 family arsenite transporter
MTADDACPVSKNKGMRLSVAIATSTMLYGLSSGAALATVVGVLIEVPLMLMLRQVLHKNSELVSA